MCFLWVPIDLFVAPPASGQIFVRITSDDVSALRAGEDFVYVNGNVLALLVPAHFTKGPLI